MDFSTILMLIFIASLTLYAMLAAYGYVPGLIHVEGTDLNGGLPRLQELGDSIANTRSGFGNK